MDRQLKEGDVIKSKYFEYINKPHGGDHFVPWRESYEEKVRMYGWGDEEFLVYKTEKVHDSSSMGRYEPGYFVAYASWLQDGEYDAGADTVKIYQSAGFTTHLYKDEIELVGKMERKYIRI